ncbi:centromere protein J-like [Vombatus ursinus]|uniref:centromere protein J-like n=1 Tax=Vombatus ursinus TaxID=29139 RepID=UPI000FFCFC28|nr:centromere protein J-like [Vombatus ursinus]
MSKDPVTKLAGTFPQSKLPLPNKNSGKVMFPLSLSMNESVPNTFTEQLAPLCYSTNCDLAVRNTVPEEEAKPSQDSDDDQQSNILANSVLLFPLMTCSRNPTGYLQATKVSGPSETLPSAPQIPGAQEQVLKQQMEQLQRLVAEQQRIITLSHSDFPFSTGMPPHLQPVSPSLASSLVRTELESSSQVPNHGNNPKITSQPLLMVNLPTLYSSSNRSSGNPEEGIEPQFPDDNSGEEEMHQKMLSPIKEDKGEHTDSQIPLSPFGVRIHSRTRNIKERPIRPAVGIRQKTFEEFVEKQFEIDSQRAENQLQQCKRLCGYPQKMSLFSNHRGE